MILSGGGGGVGAYPQDAFYFGSDLVILSLMQTKAEERVLSKNYLPDKTTDTIEKSHLIVNETCCNTKNKFE